MTSGVLAAAPDGTIGAGAVAARRRGKDNACMAHVVLFHSAYGLREVELSAAERLRAAGHDVLTPDMYAGQTARTLDAALALMDAVGWPVICERARQAVSKVPGHAVLAGFSMGAGVVGSLWGQRPQAAAVVLVHGIAPIPARVRPGLPAQLHVAQDDRFAPPEAVAQWRAHAAAAGLAADIFTYPGAGHFYTDPDLADYHAASADRTWQRMIVLLSAL